MKWKQALTNFRAARMITEPSGMFPLMIKEEIDEYVYSLQMNDEHEKIDAICDIIVLAANELALNGYDLDLCLKETAKEINSRIQDPIQACTNWKGQKWQKDPNQDKSTLYKADYSRCKLGH